VQVLPVPPPGLGTIEAAVQEAAYGAMVGHALASLTVDVVHDPWGAKTRSCRWGEFVFVEETAEEVAAVHAS
jgi:hypothetical protein